MVSIPAPPYSSGISIPIRPIAPIFLTTSYGNSPDSSYSAAMGLISLRAKSRTARRSSSCSGDNSRLIDPRFVWVDMQLTPYTIPVWADRGESSDHTDYSVGARIQRFWIGLLAFVPRSEGQAPGGSAQ